MTGPGRTRADDGRGVRHSSGGHAVNRRGQRAVRRPLCVEKESLRRKEAVELAWKLLRLSEGNKREAELQSERSPEDEAASLEACTWRTEFSIDALAASGLTLLGTTTARSQTHLRWPARPYPRSAP